MTSEEHKKIYDEMLGKAFVPFEDIKNYHLGVFLDMFSHFLQMGLTEHGVRPLEVDPKLMEEVFNRFMNLNEQAILQGIKEAKAKQVRVKFTVPVNGNTEVH